MKKLYGYDDLIKDFLEKKITTTEFESQYIKKFCNGDEPFLKEIYNKLEWLFFKVDQYTNLPIDDDEDASQYINEEQLRAAAKETLEDLKKLEAQNPQ